MDKDGRQSTTRSKNIEEEEPMWDTVLDAMMVLDELDRKLMKRYLNMTLFGFTWPPLMTIEYVEAELIKEKARLARAKKHVEEYNNGGNR